MSKNYYRNGLSIFLSFSIGLQSFNSWGLTLDQQDKEFFKTQSGSHLRALYPRIAKPSDLVKEAIKDNINRHHIRRLQGPNQAQEINKIFNTVTPMLQREINTHTTHKVFYNGYSNELDLYIATLKEFVQFSNMTDLKSAHPLRLKAPETIKNVNEFLNNFTQEYLAEAKARNVQPYDLRRNSGFTFAPDLTPFARSHTMSVNTSMFGNISTLGEDTFYYFLNSFSIGHPNETLIKNLLVTTGLGLKDPIQLQAQINAYKSFFTNKMKNAGGGLMQVLIRNKDVDRLGYASYAKGVPFFMNKKTGKFATRGGNRKSLPLLVNETDKYVRPSLNSMLDLYKQDSKAFSNKFSHANMGGIYSLDRFQARLVINPTDFTNSNVARVYRTFRDQPTASELNAVATNIKNRIKKDTITAINNNTLTNNFYGLKFYLGKMEQYLRFKGKVSASDIIEMIKKTSQPIMREVLESLQTLAKKITVAGAQRYQSIRTWVHKWNKAGRIVNQVTNTIWTEIRKAFA